MNNAKQKIICKNGEIELLYSSLLFHHFESTEIRENDINVINIAMNSGMYTEEYREDWKETWELLFSNKEFCVLTCYDSIELEQLRNFLQRSQAQCYISR